MNSGLVNKGDGFPNMGDVVAWFKILQNDFCTACESLEPGHSFRQDNWRHEDGGGGITRIIEEGDVFEKGGVNFSHVTGKQLPAASTLSRNGIAGKPFEAAGVSVVMHPVNPYVPASHMNVRFFIADPESDNPTWWFGGGYDLTPCYGFEEDCAHWHKTARNACQKFGDNYYKSFKQRCDEYFFIKHRNEPRGIGGLFFDDFNELGFEESFAFVQSIGNSFTDAYLPIVEKRKDYAFTREQQEFQRYRRGRYVEFNLVYDRGTLFGLQSNGRTESILMSLPPRVEWRYDFKAEPDSEEARLSNYFLMPRDWANQ